MAEERVTTKELREAVWRVTRPFTGGIGFVLEKHSHSLFDQFATEGMDEHGQPTLTYRVGNTFLDKESGVLMEAHLVVSVAQLRIK